MSADWADVRLNELADITMGQSPSSEFYNTESDGLPFFQGCSEFGELYPSVKKYCSQPTRIAYKDDVLMSVRAPVGALNISERTCCIGRGLCAIKSKTGDKFVYYLLKANLELIQTYSGGTTYQSINKREVNNLPFRVPPSPTQLKIAGILSAYDDLIENNTHRIAILEEMAQRIYKEWFVDFKYPGHENDKLVESEHGIIPEGWEVKKTEEVMGILGGGTPSTKISEYWKDGNINWYAPKDLTNSNSMFILESGSKINDLGLRKSSAKLFPEFSVMLTSRATIGVVSINTTEACTNQGFISCVPSEDLSVYQIYFWLLENVKMFKTLASGATFKELIKTTFRKFYIAIPPRDVSSAFNKLVDPIANEILKLHKKQVNLRQTRDMLLPKLISGKIKFNE